MSEDSVRSNTFEFGATLEQFKNTLARREALPENLDRPLRALVAQLAGLIEAGSVSVYLTSDDADRELRDHFAFLLATYLRDREKTTLLIDGDYMSVGLSGLVPQKDALGFLNLLLYGSSLGVITQDGPGHLRVIGAWSFPVSKRNPFIMEAFADAHRYLHSHSKCLLYIGPALDDADDVHPLAEHLDLVVAVGRGRRQRMRATRIDDKLEVLGGQRLWHVRIVDPPAQPQDTPVSAPPDVAAVESPQPAPAPVAEPSAPAPEPQPEREAAPMTAPAREDVADEEAVVVEAAVDPPAQAAKVPEPPPFDDTPPPAESSPNSALPKIVTSVVGVLVIAFIVWWLYQTKIFRDGAETPVAQAPPQAQPIEQSQPVQPDATAQEADAGDEETPQPATDAGGDQPAETTADPGEDAATTTAPQEPDPTPQDPPAQAQTEADEPLSDEPPAQQPATTQTTAQPPGDAAPELEPGVTVVQGLKAYGGAYLVHISSFRELDRAQAEGQALADEGFAVIVAFVDTGAKGFYHRVYVGPYRFREAARMDKIKLDEIPFVKFTRITKVPG